MKVNIDISCKYFSSLAYQRSVQFLYEALDTLIEALTAFTVRRLSFVDKQTDKSNDQAPKQHHTKKHCEMKALFFTFFLE